MFSPYGELIKGFLHLNVPLNLHCGKEVIGNCKLLKVKGIVYDSFDINGI